MKGTKTPTIERYRFNIGRLERWLVQTGHPAPQAPLDRTMRIALTSPATRPVCIAGVYGQTPVRLRDAIAQGQPRFGPGRHASTSRRSRSPSDKRLVPIAYRPRTFEPGPVWVEVREDGCGVVGGTESPTEVTESS
jgi:hypothetical protein